MNFLINILTFHGNVGEKIKNNISFFILAAFIYLFADFVSFLQPLLLNSFSTDANAFWVYGRWILYFFTLLSYLTTACILSLYFKRKDTTNSKIKNYFKPIINYRVYLVYAVLVIALPVALSVGIRFVPEVEAILSTAMKVLALPENVHLNDDGKFNIIIQNAEIIKIVESISIWQILGSILAFFSVLFCAYSAFVFALPLIIKDRSFGVFKALATSFKAVFNNLGVFLFTVLMMLIIKYLVPVILTDVMPSSVMIFITDYYINYTGRIISAIYDAFFLFYIIVGLEMFVLTNDKK